MCRRWASCGRIDQPAVGRERIHHDHDGGERLHKLLGRCSATAARNPCDAPLVHLSHRALAVYASYSILVAGASSATPAFYASLLDQPVGTYSPGWHACTRNCWRAVDPAHGALDHGFSDR